MNWEVEMLFDLTESKLEQVIAKINLLKATPTTVRNLHQLLANTGNFPTFQRIYIFNYWHNNLGSNNFWNHGLSDKKIFYIETTTC